MNLQTYLSIKEAAAGVAPMPGPTQYTLTADNNVSNANVTPRRVQSISTLGYVARDFMNGINSHSISDKNKHSSILHRSPLSRFLSSGIAGGSVLPYRPIGPLMGRSRLPEPSPQSSHTATLLAKIRHLDKLQKEEVDKHWNSKDYWTTADGKPTPKWDKYNRKRHNALRYLENTDKHEYWRYLHNDLGVPWQ